MNRPIPDDEYQKKQGKRASVKAFRQAVIINAESGRGLLYLDPEAFHCSLEPTVDDAVLGDAVLSALAASRFLGSDASRAFGSESDERWGKWVARVLAATGIKSEQRLFQRMVSCGVSEREGVIEFWPTIKRRGMAWEGLGKECHIKVAKNASPFEIGSALREALSACVPSIFE